MSKKCADCGCEVNRNVIQGMYYCPRCDDDKREIDVLPMTLFDHITTSPEVLAPHFVFLKAVFVTNINPKQQWISTITGDVYSSRAEAIAATVAKLKEVEND